MAVGSIKTGGEDAQQAPKVISTPEPAPQAHQTPQAQPVSEPVRQTTTQHKAPTQEHQMNQQFNDNTEKVAAPKLMSLVNLVGSVSSLSDKGRKYFDRIKEELSSVSNQNKLNIKIHSLTSPENTMALECGGKFILLTPSETLSNLPEGLPRTVVLKDAVGTYHTAVSGTHELLLFLVITPADYECVEKMITAIQNLFVVATRPEFQNLTADMLKDPESIFVISTNVSDVQNFMTKIYPHAVSPRADMGFVLYQKGRNRQGGYNTNPASYFDQGAQENVPIACVTAFTEPVQLTGAMFNSVPKFVPLIHITSTISVIPAFELTTLLLPLATDVFIRSGLWKTQFSQFSKEQPNIGKLFRDPNTNMPGFAENPTQREQILATTFENPALVLDVVEGTYRIPGLEKYGIAERNSDVTAMYGRFLGANIMDTVASGFKYHEYVGVITHNGRQADSRWADYLNTIIHFESEVNTVYQLLVRNTDPKVRVDQIKRFYPSFEVLYSNIVCEINLNFMMTVQNLIRDKIQISQNSVLGAQNLVDLTSLIANAQAFNQNAHSGFNYGGGGGVFMNPFGRVY